MARADADQCFARKVNGSSGRSGNLEVLGRALAAIADELILDPLTVVERAKAGALHRRDVYEHILAAVGRLDEAVAFGRVEPLHSSASHLSISSCGGAVGDPAL